MSPSDELQPALATGVRPRPGRGMKPGLLFPAGRSVLSTKMLGKRDVKEGGSLCFARGVLWCHVQYTSHDVVLSKSFCR